MTFQTELQEVLPEKHLLQGSDLYEKSNGAYFTVFESEIKPAVIARPTTAQEVGALIKKLHPKLVTQETSLAIKGTGHTPFAGAANVENGITLALEGLKGLSLAESRDYVTIGVGETWGSVYTELQKHGLTAPGGRVGRVGVPGLILGGGMSFFSTKYGFACDSVIDFEVVLASGDIVHANAKDNTDLFVSLKGGLNNFGIVTAMSLKTIPSSDIWGGVAYYIPDTFGQLIEATVDFVNNETDEDTHIMSSAGYGFGHDVCTCCMYHLKGDKEAPALKRFTTLPGAIEGYGTLRTGDHMNFCDELSKFTQDGIRSFYATLTIKADVALMKELHQIWLEILEPLRPLKGFIFSYGYFPLTKALLRNSKEAGDNAKDIDPVDGPLFVVLINPTWDLSENDDQVYSAVEDLLQRLKKTASEKGLLHRYIFTNYAYHKEEVLAGYGEQSVNRLREVSQKYDPEGIFQKSVPGGFKLPKA
ncbi:FAD-binding domain-containing protein [Amniculicola lignicola CBS 123094]|uniref:FAD-binding domain-containing protein n=1 Tax=Amniculicola lignicola CBS 123094 TaxID=1392246 RepID=A0A6A5W4X4_9PLEO|nr:FAD-binding domain-containing protein [Amniculicola lignicola CBS 123094]